MVSIPFESLCSPASMQVAAERCARNKTLYTMSAQWAEKSRKSHGDGVSV